MIYPVGIGTREDFEEDWYIAQGFGNPTTYGFHDGIDINIKTGGDTDLGQELKSIASGRIVYYHFGSHPNTGYGRHLIYRIEGPWGVRWVHYAHCTENGFLNAPQDVPEGKIIAYLGKSGTATAHLHMSIFKVDPGTFGIDNIPNTQEELNKYWEDPLTFLNKWTVPEVATTPVITDQTIIPANLLNWSQDLEVQQVRSILNDQNNKINSLESKIVAAKAALS